MTIRSHNSPYWKIFLKQDCRCYWCRETLSLAEITKDHLLPKSQGNCIVLYHDGYGHRASNVVLSCSKCNSIKSNLTLTEFEAKMREKLTRKLVNPLWYVILKSITEAHREVDRQTKITKRILKQREIIKKQQHTGNYKAWQERLALRRSRVIRRDEVKVLAQKSEIESPEICGEVLGQSTGWWKTLFSRIKTFITKQ